MLFMLMDPWWRAFGRAFPIGQKDYNWPIRIGPAFRISATGLRTMGHSVVELAPMLQRNARFYASEAKALAAQ